MLHQSVPGPESKITTEQELKLDSATLPAPSSFTYEVFLNLESKRLSQLQEVLKFDDFQRRVELDPARYVRNAAHYAVNALDDWGHVTEDYCGVQIKRFNVLNQPWLSEQLKNRESLFGFEYPLYKIYQELEGFSKSGQINRGLLLFGDTGSGKTTLANLLLKVLETYSTEREGGALYRLAFYFDSNEQMNTISGFNIGASVKATELQKGFRIASAINCDPLFLIPNTRTLGSSEATARELLLSSLLKKDSTINGDYLLRGELDSTSQAIYHGLVRYYGDVKEVFEKHIRCERYTMSLKSGEGLALIRPKNTPHTSAEPMSNPRFRGRLNSHHAIDAVEDDIHLLKGGIVQASRGAVHFEDIFARNDHMPLSELTFLHEVLERGSVQTVDPESGATLTNKVESLFLLTTPGEQIYSHMDTPAWRGINNRLIKIPVASKVRYKDEEGAHRERLTELLQGTSGYAGPHALTIFSLFATATRLITPRSTDYDTIQPGLSDAIKTLNVVGKALILQGFGEHHSVQDLLAVWPKGKEFVTKSDVLAQLREKLFTEYTKGLGVNNFLFFDGSVGASTRPAQDMLSGIIANSKDHLFIIPELIKGLKKLTEQGMEHDVRIHKQRAAMVENKIRMNGGSGNSSANAQAQQAELDKKIKEVKEEFPLPTAHELLGYIAEYAKHKVRSDIMKSLPIVAPQQVEFELARYIEHVKAYVRKDKGGVRAEYRLDHLLNDSSPNENVMTSIERVIMPEIPVSRKDAQRESLLSALSSWALNSTNQGKNVMENVRSIFPDQYDRLVKFHQFEAEEKIRNFVADVKQYAHDPALVERDRNNATVATRFKIWEAGFTGLEKLGYRADTIPSHVVWVYEGK